MPILWLLVLGPVLWRWQRLSRALFLAATALFLTVNLPASGRLPIAGLQGGAPRPRVILVTSAAHIVRMSAVLRRRGVEVIFAEVAGGDVGAWTPGELLPSYQGLETSQAALRGYLGIVWYLATNLLDFEGF